MGQPLSMDLRPRLLAAIDARMSCPAAPARFGVAPSTAIRWQAQRRATGSVAPSARVATGARAALKSGAREILALWEARSNHPARATFR